MNNNTSKTKLFIFTILVVVIILSVFIYNNPSVKVESVKKGKSCTVEGLEITVKSYSFSEYCGDVPGYSRADDGFVYCNIYVNVKNPSNQTIVLNDGISGLIYFTLVYDSEYEYNTSKFSSDGSVFLYGNEDLIPLGELTNRVVSIQVPIEVKESDNSLEVVVKKNSRRATEAFSYKLR